MNYIKEINAFYDTIERNPLSTSAVTLWHALMHINNKAHWMPTFTVAASVLKYKTALTDSTFKRARTELATKGYITYESRTGNLAPSYQIISLIYHEAEVSHHTQPATNAPAEQQQEYPSRPKQEQHTSIQADHTMDHQTNHPVKSRTDQKANHQPDHTVYHNLNHEPDRNPDPLSKQNKTKPKETKQHHNQPDQTTAILFYQQHFGTPSPFVTKAMLTWINNTSDELVIYAMERTLDQGKTTWAYTKAILQTWTTKGIRTVEAAKSDSLNFRKHQQHTTKEIIPEWFQALEQSKQHQPTRQPKSTQDEATLLAETQALLDACT